MKKLTAEKCRERIEWLEKWNLSIAEEVYLQALEIALPILDQQEQESRCQQCGGTGWAGGNRPWGEPVTVECDCQFEQQESQKEVSHD